ncbi:MAG TPA: type II secretion system inner membrane protein GspF [Polyangia bacterium]|jgi:general secretion pathway protein F|nr:type II secretion system inner membrane protein GspF [Polyangia bacterium]
MPVFTWKGLSAAGKAVGGTRDADSAKGLRLVLRRDGIFVTEHREMLAGGAKASAGKGVAQAGGAAVPFFKRDIDLGGLVQRVQPQEVAVFTRQLATLLRAGIPLAEALSALSEQSENKRFEVILTGVRQKVNEGGSLAETLAKHPKIFPELYTNMVRSGEAAGNLDAVLARLADFLDAQYALRSKVSSAMTYPIIMMVLGSGIMGLLLVVVVPKITSIFEDVGKSLPWNTNLLIFVSDTVASYWWALLLVGGLGYWGFRTWAGRPKGRATVDRLKLRVWLLGPLVRYVGVARFARTLSTMLAAGVPVLTALEIVKKVLNNVVLEKVVDEARDAIREGESIAAPLRRSGQFPSMMVHMVAVGERSGQLETMLENVAIAYERDVDAKVSRLTTVLSPLLIVIMAMAVGFIVLSILQPIMDMQNFTQ